MRASRVNPTCVDPGANNGNLGAGGSGSRLALAHGSECKSKSVALAWPGHARGCPSYVSAREPPRHLHALHAVAGEMAPDHGVAHQLVGARREHAGAGMELEVDLGHL